MTEPKDEDLLEEFFPQRATGKGLVRLANLIGVDVDVVPEPLEGGGGPYRSAALRSGESDEDMRARIAAAAPRHGGMTKSAVKGWFVSALRVEPEHVEVVEVEGKYEARVVIAASASFDRGRAIEAAQELRPKLPVGVRLRVFAGDDELETDETARLARFVVVHLPSYFERERAESLADMVCESGSLLNLVFELGREYERVESAWRSVGTVVENALATRKAEPTSKVFAPAVLLERGVEEFIESLARQQGNASCVVLYVKTDDAHVRLQVQRLERGV